MMKEYSLNHITNYPHYLQSNGLAEKFVQIVKNLFYKANEEGKDLFKGLMIYPNTPLTSSLQSPMQIYKVEVQDQIYQCQMLQENNLVLTQSNLETSTRMNIYLHMTCMWVKV